MPVATSAADAKVMLEALEAGTDGVVLKTNSAAEVIAFPRLPSLLRTACATRRAGQG